MQGFQFRGTQDNYSNTRAEEGGILCIDSSVSISLGASISLTVPSQLSAWTCLRPTYANGNLQALHNNYQPNGADPINHSPHTAKQREHVPK